MAFLQLFLVLAAVSAVAIADIFLKKTQTLDPFYKAFTSPWMLGAILLYLFQIFFFTYLFEIDTKLSYVGVLQTALYACIVLLAGVFVFGETFTPLQIFGMVLALSGAIILSL
jgi:drug/metabolite transporter (DMT)-like permease